MKLIRQISWIIFAFLTVVAASCNRGESSGDNCSIEGTVYKVLHPDDNYNLEANTCQPRASEANPGTQAKPWGIKNEQEA